MKPSDQKHIADFIISVEALEEPMSNKRDNKKTLRQNFENPPVVDSAFREMATKAKNFERVANSRAPAPLTPTAAVHSSAAPPAADHLRDFFQWIEELDHP